MTRETKLVVFPCPTGPATLPKCVDLIPPVPELAVPCFWHSPRWQQCFVDCTQQPEIKTVEDFLDSIENQQLYQILIKVDKLTLQIALLKIQGYSTREIAHSLNITEKAVYRRMDRLKEKLKNFFE